MKKQTIFINQRHLVLDAAQLIQSGGEGMVFGTTIGGREVAIKLYHDPRPAHAAKLARFCSSGLAQRLPAAVLGPQQLVKDRQGKVTGFQMARLPAGTHPLKKLSNYRFRQKQQVTTASTLQLFQQMHATLQAIHDLGCVVGDLNDHNLAFAVSPRPVVYWLDVDSYQIDSFPCPVAMLPFLDPGLYHVADFSARPVFSPRTDWYAFFVLLLKSVLGVHPYGGTHKQYKTLQARAQAGVTLLDPAVTYPHHAPPPEILSDDLLHYLHQVFAAGQREVFPARLLAACAAGLTHCNACGVAYPRRRAHCPACRVQTPAPPALPAGTLRVLLRPNGMIEYVKVLANGRLLAITRKDKRYHLHYLGIGGSIREAPLFSGSSGYRFAAFETADGRLALAVNPPLGTKLLLLDVSGAQPRQITMLETGRFRESAVFAATPTHLLRIAGNWIMRGTVRNGLFVEDPIATAHLHQTRFWAAPEGETIAGYHRIFAERRFWLWHEGCGYDVDLPPLPGGASLQETAVAFAEDLVAYMLTIRERGRLRPEIHLVNQQGALVRSLFDSPCLPHHFPFTAAPAQAVPPLRLLPDSLEIDAAARLLRHPRGVVRERPSALHFLSTIPS